MVNLTRIYTRTGDDGTTSLGDFSRVSKNDARLHAYADSNEANAAIGIAVACGELPDEVKATLQRVQNELFDVGADLSTPLRHSYAYPPLRVEQPWVDDLERDCDHYLEQVEKLRSFILPGGTPGSAHLHLATTIVRRAERSAWAAVDQHGTEAAPSDTDGRGIGGGHGLAAKDPHPPSGPPFLLAPGGNKPHR